MGFLESLSPLSRSLNTKHQILFSLSQHAELAKKFSPKKKFTFNFLQLSFRISIMLQKSVPYIRDSSNLPSTTLHKTQGPNMGA